MQVMATLVAVATLVAMATLVAVNITLVAMAMAALAAATATEAQTAAAQKEARTAAAVEEGVGVPQGNGLPVLELVRSLWRNVEQACLGQLAYGEGQLLSAGSSKEYQASRANGPRINKLLERGTGRPRLSRLGLGLGLVCSTGLT